MKFVIDTDRSRMRLPDSRGRLECPGCDGWGGYHIKGSLHRRRCNACGGRGWVPYNFSGKYVPHPDRGMESRPGRGVPL